LSDGGSTITGYDVYEGTSPDDEGATAVNGTTLVTNTSYPVTGLTNGTRYYFTVEAVNAVGNSAASNEASATPTSNTCAAYTGNEAFFCATYEDLLGRAPDPGGLTYWVPQLAGGVSDESVMAAFVGSPEFYTDMIT
jgi:hypothetical protein